MPYASANDVRLYYEEHGDGEPLVMVHGSWGDHANWALVVPRLAEQFRVITYDRRGHSRIELPASQGSYTEDGRDLLALIRAVDLGPSHVAGNSGGSAIALNAAVEEPSSFRTLIIHEPALPALLGDDRDLAIRRGEEMVAPVRDLLERGEDEAAAKLFANTFAFGPDAWETRVPAELKATMIHNAPTFLDELRDPVGSTWLDLSQLAEFDKPALVTSGTRSAPWFPQVAERVAAALPRGRALSLTGADNVPHISMPELYIETVVSFISERR